jgi:adenine-specific DNA-methyltransferase
MTTWKVASHSASDYATPMTRALLGGRHFPYPKSLYAVEDALRFFVMTKPDAVVLDFFSGSGTTAHAVMRLNRQDGGRRQCISVTNNEVSAEEQRGLRRRGLRPGDDDWESQGICDYITKARVTAAITGKTPEGEPIKGDYKFTDEFPMSEGFEENAAFFTLTYEAPLSVRHNRAFERIAPMLWLRAGSQGRIITDLGEDGWDVAETYGVLENLDQAGDFVARLSEVESVRTAFIVTDDDSAFQMVCRDLPSAVLPVRLYESYLQNFMLRGGR